MGTGIDIYLYKNILSTVYMIKTSVSIVGYNVISIKKGRFIFISKEGR